jgi:Na+-transporting methylmalonyl-CoA/oxaloacetate decarboxylase gamma subunit
VNDLLAIALDAKLADHWPDGLVLALLSVLAYLVTHYISALEDRINQAYVQIGKNADCVGELNIRVTKMETVAEERERRGQFDRNHGND